MDGLHKGLAGMRPLLRRRLGQAKRSCEMGQRPAAPPHHRHEGIAAMLCLTRQHVTDRLTKRRDFPRPVIDLSRPFSAARAAS